MNNTDNYSLIPCPFCGGDNANVHSPYFVSDFFGVECADCHCTTALFLTVEEAVEAWNQRAKNDER